MASAIELNAIAPAKTTGEGKAAIHINSAIGISPEKNAESTPTMSSR